MIAIRRRLRPSRRDREDRWAENALQAARSLWLASDRVDRAEFNVFARSEEFSVLLPDCGLDNAMEIAERLRTAQPEGTCSIGVAAWDGRESATEHVARADRALYAAKAGGRNRCRVDAAADAEPAARTPTS